MEDVADKKVTVTIPFSTHDYALLTYSVLNIDKDWKETDVQRVMLVDGSDLQITFLSEDMRKLRAATNSYLKNVLLVVKTIARFNLK